MRKLHHQLQKIVLILIIICSIKSNMKAQEIPYKKESRIYTSTDVTFNGLQGRIAYDFYTAKGNCLGFSIAQLGGLKRMNEDNTIYYNIEDIRLNLSFRYTKDLIERKRLKLFAIVQTGISYNTNLTGEQLLLPSFRVGGGSDIILFKSSGIRLEAGIGSPYFVSIGYFFTI
jgi:hypothetical protein